MEFQLAQAIEILERTPATLAALLTGISGEWVHSREARDTFSPNDVLCHLIYGEETDWMPRLLIILNFGVRKPFEPFDRTGGEKHAALPVEQLLEAFRMVRLSNLKELRALNLTAEDLVRRGRHPALGDVTAGEILSAWVVHDLGHIAQVARVMSRRYRQDVGPFREYLTILG